MKNFSYQCYKFQLPWILKEIELMQNCETAKELTKEIIKDNEQIIENLTGDRRYPDRFISEQEQETDPMSDNYQPYK